VIGFALLMLVECGHTDYADNPRKMLALAGAANLREAFNRGECRKIFDEADEAFRISQTDWAKVDGSPSKAESGNGMAVTLADPEC
jgi:hypothetical protein